MSELRDLQLRFQDYLITGNESIEADISSNADALAQHRLGVYYNAYRLRLIDALAVDFAALNHYLGRAAFENLTLDYLKHYPSRNPSVRWFGGNLSRYITEHYQGDDHEFVQELCDYAWAKSLLFDKVHSEELFQPGQMATLPPEAWATIRFHFKPAMQWLDLYWNIPAIANAAESEVESEVAMPDKQRDEHPQRWLLWRQDMRIHWRSLEVHEAWAIEQAADGANFSEICEGLCEWVDPEQVALTAAGFMRQWLTDQLVQRLEFDA
ncbi:MAG: hypothetical protein ACI9LO_002716 [Planctomycetota bacterium]|jgi:hypothetical protein